MLESSSFSFSQVFSVCQFGLLPTSITASAAACSPAAYSKSRTEKYAAVVMRTSRLVVDELAEVLTVALCVDSGERGSAVRLPEFMLARS